MATIKPFRCVLPAADKVDKIAALPYDVYNRKEAKQIVVSNPQSFLAIDRAETSFPDEVDIYDPRVYEKARELFQAWINDGSFVREEQEYYYIYELTMNDRTQTGIVGCASIDDYASGVIKKHENTRADKEQDRINHVDTCSAQTGPIFLAYRANEKIRSIVREVKREQEGQAYFDFESEDGIRHTVYVISDPEQIKMVSQIFADMGAVYIADGHHRASSAVKVGFKRRSEHPDYDGTEEFNYFLSVLFPDDELFIMDYNRVLKDLNGMSEEQFLEKMKELFEVRAIAATEDTAELTGEADGGNRLSESDVRPAKKGEFAMFLGNVWYHCQMRPEDVPDDPVKGLDVSVLQEHLLAPVLGITDPKTDARIDFVGGIRGLKELEHRCHTDCKVAFAMYPTSIQELFAVADAGLLMPPKSTWFEPKLRSGLFIHEI